MKKIVCFTGSPRLSGNSTLLLNEFLAGIDKNYNQIEIIDPYKINVNPCKGCLRCNVLKRCSVESDDWKDISTKILKADILVFASPIYFHHFPAQLKLIIDRFRSFMNIKLTDEGLEHKPWVKWQKDFVLLLTLGSSNTSDTQPVIDLFEYITDVLGEDNKLYSIKVRRMVAPNQINKDIDFLEALYRKLGIDVKSAQKDFEENVIIKKRCAELARYLTKS